MMRRMLFGPRPFHDRADAGRRLAQLLQAYRGPDAIVLALPRGGVEVGYEVARLLGAPLDVIVARKLGAPAQRELGIGAIAPGGVRVLDRDTIALLGIPPAQIDAVVAEETAEMERRERAFRGGLPAPDLAGCSVILVDDGLATGVTARAAIRAIRAARPRRIVLAVPVCPPETAAALRSEVDELVCVESPADFLAVGRWYENFDQTSDEEVIELLARARRETPPRPHVD
ncbi:MAG TPA: phosphoribosyltransferase [Dehalococcoidia bacterium]|nr:phosphoribosyltransferase [Dehalococcoidia bacterium]